MSERTPIFERHFQRELLALMIRSTKFLTEIRPLIKPEHFLSEEQSIICQVAYNYFDHYRKAPRKHLRTDLEKYVEETRISKERHSLTKKYLKHLERTQPQNQKYLKDEVSRFVQYQEVRQILEKFIPEYEKTGLPQLLEKVIPRLNSALRIGESQKLVSYAEIKSKPVDWLWKPYIPKGQVTLMDGDPGVGKSLICTKITASITQGFLPNSQEKTKPSNVLIFSEDPPDCVVKPRLEALDANYKRVFGEPLDSEDEELRLSEEGLRKLTSYVRQYKISLVIIDPIINYLNPETDINKANAVRDIMRGLKRVAREYNCAIVAVRHLNKTPGGRAMYRGYGSIDFRASARSSLLVGHDADDPSQAAIVHHKSNLSKLGPTLGYEIHETGARGEEIAHIMWTGESDLTAGRILAGERPERITKLDQAKDLLLEILKDGRVELEEVKRVAKEAGISETTLQRAKRELNIDSDKEGFTDPLHYWRVPSEKQEPEPEEEAGVVSGDVSSNKNDTIRSISDWKSKKNKDLVESCHDDTDREENLGYGKTDMELMQKRHRELRKELKQRKELKKKAKNRHRNVSR